MIADERGEPILERMLAIAAESEVFDTVQIIATSTDSETQDTIRLDRGFGNWYARSGATRHWLKMHDAADAAHAAEADNG